MAEGVDQLEPTGFYKLGRLCKRKHKWRDRFVSLRYVKNRGRCVVCRREQYEARRKDDPDAERARVRGAMRRRRESPDVRRRESEANAQYCRDRRKRDESFKVRQYLRARLGVALKRYGDGKKMPAGKYGIDYAAIIEHLGPCPGVHGRRPDDFQIDHIKPLCEFDLSDQEQVREAFAPENHRWLKTSANLERRFHG